MAEAKLYIIGKTEDYPDVIEHYQFKAEETQGYMGFSNDETKILIQEDKPSARVKSSRKVEFSGNRSELTAYMKLHSDEWAQVLEEKTKLYKKKLTTKLK